LSVRKWDFLFYVVRPSRHELREGVGVLAVFSFLIVPIVCSTLLGRRGQGRLYWAWAIGIVVSILGAVFSYLKDWPMGATIVCLFGVTVAIISLSVRMKYVDAVANGEHHSTGELRDAEEVPIRAAGR
jgi:zinc/manganese transport system permease protein